MHPSDPSADRATGRDFLALCLAATGVVYGDIGTSPLYTWNELVRTGTLEGPTDVIGAASLVFWTLTLAISVKYVLLVIRADNHGEGGTFALMGLLHGLALRGGAAIVGVLTFAACLLYADGLITPAISVLGALEGLAVFSPSLQPAVVPASLVILTGLFAVQSAGTARVGRVFGVVTVVWFLAIGVIGVARIAQHPGILAALLPHHAVSYLAGHGLPARVAILGAVVLAITGGEALYADIGHFGARAVRVTWTRLVYPALVLNYLGQGAWLYGGEPVSEGNVFFSMVPAPLLVPMLLLSVAAAVIASQALISGAFSLTRSAAQLGLLPRLRVIHTNADVEGQIYLPAVNWLLWAGCCGLVLWFGSSSALAAAYGLAVMGVALATTFALGVVARYRWGWSTGVVVAVFGGFALFDGAFLAANAVKIPEGAWLSLLVAMGLYGVMLAWRRGRAELADAYRAVPRVAIGSLVAARPGVLEMPRAMVFLVSEPVRAPEDATPILLLRFLDLYGALPRHLTLFTVVHEPAVPRWTGERFEVTALGAKVVSVRMHVGWLDRVDVRAALQTLKDEHRIKLHATHWTIVVGREDFAMPGGGPFWSARMWLFRALVSASSGVRRWFGLQDDTGLSLIEIPVEATPQGMRVELRVPKELLGPTELGEARRVAR